MVTVVDAVNFTKDYYEAKDLQEIGESLGEEDQRSVADLLVDQVEFADIILISKTDLVNKKDIDKLKGLYEWVNIKLDKTGGLTEACNLAHAAQDRGFNLMVGCMVGTSLAMAPATLLGSYAKVVDLDGPLLLAEDRPEGLRFDNSYIYPPDTLLWG